MKRNLVVISVIGILLVASGAGVALYFADHDDEDDLSDWDGTHIVDFDKFQYLGAGVSVNSPNSLSNVIYYPVERTYSDDENEDTKYKMVGITGSGQCEVIKFEDKDGKEIDQRANLIRFVSEKTYSIATFSTDSSEYRSPVPHDHFHSVILYSAGCFVDYLGDFEKAHGFMIDNKTGNMYSLKTVIERIQESYGFNCVTITIGGDLVYGHISDDTDLSSEQLLQFVFTERELQLVPIMDEQQMANFLNRDSTGSLHVRLDRFSNALSVEDINYESYPITSVTKFMKTDRSFSTMEAADPNHDENLYYEYQYAFNDIVYERAYSVENSTKTLVYTAYLNSEGTFVQTTAEKIGGTYFDLSTLGYTDSVGAVMESTWNGTAYQMKVAVAKYDADSPWTYTVDRVNVGVITSTNGQDVRQYIKNCAFNGTNVYCFDGSSLFDLDVDTLELTQINTPNEIRSISFDDDVRQVKITAVVISNMQSVEGYIDESKTGDEKLIFEPYVLRYNDREVISIAPINV